MRIRYFFPAAITLCFFLSPSCKKSDAPTPDPVPVIQPDTLGPGWTKKIISGETNLSDVFFNSTTTGFLVGAKIYKSTDGGNTWSPVLSTNGIINAFMTSDGKAFFANNEFRIVKTIDGGSTFVSTSIAGESSDIFFIDNNIGYCVTRENFIYNTMDGGLTWTKITTSGLPAGAAYSTISCINNTTGWVATTTGIYRTMGAFNSWQQANIIGGTSPVYFTSLYATSASIIYAGSNAEIFKSSDAGVNFSFLKKLGSGGLTDIHFFNDLEGYASVDRSIFKTTDGGLNWTKVVSLGQGYIVEIHFSDMNHGWACGDSIVLTFKQ